MARTPCTDRDLRQRRERKYRLRGGAAVTKRFIPDADRDFAQMARLFAQHVARHAERLGFSTEKVEEVSGAAAAFRGALSKTMQRDCAGPRATAIKNEARKQAETIIRAAGRHLRGTAEEALTDVDRMHLNLPQRPKRGKRRACPQVAPLLRFIGSTDPYGRSAHGGRHILEYGNDFDAASSAKPRGAVRLELFVELVPPLDTGETIPLHPAERSGGRLWYLGSFTTRRFEVQFPVLVDERNRSLPMLVVYWGRWADASGGVGPFSQTCVARVEGGAWAGEVAPEVRAALPGARQERICVTPLVAGQLEARLPLRRLVCSELEVSARRG